MGAHADRGFHSRVTRNSDAPFHKDASLVSRDCTLGFLQCGSGQGWLAGRPIGLVRVGSREFCTEHLVVGIATHLSDRATLVT